MINKILFLSCDRFAAGRHAQTERDERNRFARWSCRVVPRDHVVFVLHSNVFPTPASNPCVNICPTRTFYIISRSGLYIEKNNTWLWGCDSNCSIHWVVFQWGEARRNLGRSTRRSQRQLHPPECSEWIKAIKLRRLSHYERDTLPNPVIKPVASNFQTVAQ